jgi:hypothetical protein
MLDSSNDGSIIADKIGLKNKGIEVCIRVDVLPSTPSGDAKK